jgi:hypothetical protein
VLLKHFQQALTCCFLQVLLEQGEVLPIWGLKITPKENPKIGVSKPSSSLSFFKHYKQPKRVSWACILLKDLIFCFVINFKLPTPCKVIWPCQSMKNRKAMVD